MPVITRHNINNFAIHCTYEEFVNYQHEMNKCYFDFKNEKITFDELAIKLDDLYENFTDEFAYDTTERY